MRYAAFGDSYTIGTSVAQEARFPDQLVAALLAEGRSITLVANLGVNGYTSADLIRDELPRLDAVVPDVATVCIGVNDVVQGVPLASYERNAGAILDRLLERLPAGRILTVAIPDYTVTPAGADYGEPAARHAGIVAANGTMARLATARGIPFVDIFDLSLLAADDASLVAEDGLHPSGAQYALWVDRLLPPMRAALDG